jgi:hypothetical protein
MNLQTVLAASAAGLSALYFIRGAIQELGAGQAPSSGGSCGKCSSGGCPAARKA